MNFYTLRSIFTFIIFLQSFLCFSQTLPSPTNVVVNPIYGSNQLRLTWRDNSTTETSFVIQVQIGGSGAFLPIAAALPGNFNFSCSSSERLGSQEERTTLINGIAPGTAYQFRLAASDGMVSSAAVNSNITANTIVWPVAGVQHVARSYHSGSNIYPNLNFHPGLDITNTGLGGGYAVNASRAGVVHRVLNFNDANHPGTRVAIRVEVAPTLGNTSLTNPIYQYDYYGNLVTTALNQGNPIQSGQFIGNVGGFNNPPNINSLHFRVYKEEGTWVQSDGMGNNGNNLLNPYSIFPQALQDPGGNIPIIGNINLMLNNNPNAPILQDVDGISLVNGLVDMSVSATDRNGGALSGRVTGVQAMDYWIEPRPINTNIVNPVGYNFTSQAVASQMNPNSIDFISGSLDGDGWYGEEGDDYNDNNNLNNLNYSEIYDNPVFNFSTPTGQTVIPTQTTFKITNAVRINNQLLVDENNGWNTCASLGTPNLQNNGNVINVNSGGITANSRGPSALLNHEAYFPDGRYVLNSRARDFINSSNIARIPVTVDNHWPYIQRVIIENLNANGAVSRISYDASWRNTTNSSKVELFDRINGQIDPNQAVRITAITSEPMQAFQLRNIIPQGGAQPIAWVPQTIFPVNAGNLTTQQTIFRFVIPSQTFIVNSNYRLDFDGTDLAGHPLVPIGANPNPMRKDDFISRNCHNGNIQANPTPNQSFDLYHLLRVIDVPNTGLQSLEADFNVSGGITNFPNQTQRVLSFSATIDPNNTGDVGNPPYTLEWRFKNGGISDFQTQTIQNPNNVSISTTSPPFTFNEGSYDVELRITDDNNVVKTIKKQAYIKIGNPLDANFNISTANTYHIGDPIDFNAAPPITTGGTPPYQYSFSFDRGANPTNVISSSTNTVEYTTAGFKTITLTVLDAAGNVDSETKNIKIEYGGTVGPDPLYSEINSHENGLTVDFFTNASGGTWPYSYKWYFGDGASDLTNTYATQHTYPASGNYTVSLAVKDINGMERIVTKTIVVTDSLLPSFTSPSIAGKNVNVKFTNTSKCLNYPVLPGSNDFYEYTWDYGDNSSESCRNGSNWSTCSGGAFNGSHTYQDTGTYVVSLVARLQVWGQNTSAQIEVYSNTIKIVESDIAINDVLYTHCATELPSNSCVDDWSYFWLDVSTTPGNEVAAIKFSTQPFVADSMNHKPVSNNGQWVGGHFWYHILNPDGLSNNIPSGFSRSDSLNSAYVEKYTNILTSDIAECGRIDWLSKYPLSILKLKTQNFVQHRTLYITAYDLAGNVSQYQKQLTFYPKVDINPGGPYTICPNASDSIQLQVQATGGDGQYQFNWGFGNISNPTVMPDTTTEYSLMVHSVPDAQGGWSCNSLIKLIPVSVEDISIQLPSAINICKPNNLGRRIEAVVTGGSGKYTFDWSPKLGLSNYQIANPYVQRDRAGTYRYTLTVTDATGCSDQATIDVTITHSTLSVNTAISDTLICPRDIINLRGFVIGGSPDYKKLWLNSSNNIIHSTAFTASTSLFKDVVTKTDEIYTFKVIDNAGCLAESKISTSVLAPTATISANLPSTEVCEGTWITADAIIGNTNGFNFFWEDKNGTFITSSTTLAINAKSDKYYLIAEHPLKECKLKVDSITIKFRANLIEDYIHIAQLHKGTVSGSSPFELFNVEDFYQNYTSVEYTEYLPESVVNYLINTNQQKDAEKVCESYVKGVSKEDLLPENSRDLRRRMEFKLITSSNSPTEFDWTSGYSINWKVYKQDLNSANFHQFTDVTYFQNKKVVAVRFDFNEFDNFNGEQQYFVEVTLTDSVCGNQLIKRELICFETDYLCVGYKKWMGLGYSVRHKLALPVNTSPSYPQNTVVTEVSQIPLTNFQYIQNYWYGNNTLFGNKINTSSTTTVNSNNVTDFRAAEQINLNPGFWAKSGSSFTAKIKSGICSTPTTNNKQTVRLETNTVNDSTTNLSDNGSGKFVRLKASDDSLDGLDNLIKVYPNPFKNEFIIEINLAVEEKISIEISNSQGKLIQVIDAEIKQARTLQKISINGENLAEGVYYYKINTIQGVSSGKLIKLK